MLLMAAAATSVGAQGSDPEFDHAKEFRQSMGFEAGDAYVLESLADPERFPSDAWGVPLTNAETNELYRRSRMVLDASDTVAEAGRMDGFAGVYMDHDRDGRLVFQFSKGVQAAEQAISASMPSDVDFGVRKVEHSLEELDAVGEDLLSRADRLLDLDVQLVSLRYDIQNNRVVAAVDGSTSRAEPVFEDVNGAFRVVAGEAAVLDACNDVTDCPPAKGGIRINDGTFCTSAVVGKRRDGSPHRVLITAGHCLQGNADGTWTHSGEVVGTDEARVWSQSSSAPYPVINSDIGIIDLDDGFLPADGSNNKFVFTNSGTVWRFGDLENPPTETPVCTIGAGSESKAGWPAKRCGKVEAYYIVRLTCQNPGTQPPCAWVDFSVSVDFDSTGGDSGAPYWIDTGSSPYTLIGIHTHSDEDGSQGPYHPGKEGWYVSITRGLYYLSQKSPPVIVHACIDGDCTAP
jgi:hypothetical protein